MELPEIVGHAESKAGLHRSLGGFDGDASVWIWRLSSKPDRTIEARLRARPDPHNEGVQLEVSAAAWFEKRREVAASRVIWSQFLPKTALADAWKVIGVLSQHLADARETAPRLGDRLDDVARGRDRLMDDLKKVKLLEG